MLRRAPRPPEIVITVDGELALTVEQATERAAPKITSVDGMRRELSRQKVPHVAALDGKKKLYLATVIDGMLANRPGTGSPGKPRK